MGQFEPRTSNYFSALSEDHATTSQSYDGVSLDTPNKPQHQSTMVESTASGNSDQSGGIDIDVSCEAQDKEVRSPVSDNSSGILPGQASSNLDSNEKSTPTSSRISLDCLNFENLSIDYNGVHGSNGPDKYIAPFQRMFQGSNDTSFSEDIPNRREFGISHTISPFSGRSGGRVQRSSNTWISADAQAQQEFMVIRNAMRRLFKNSDVAKWKLADYIAHREAVVASQANILAIKVKAREEAISLRIPPISLESQENLHRWGIFGNFEQYGNLGRVLGEQTIWCHDWTRGKDEIAPWPSLAELKWEGDDRAKTGVGRFLPLPREEAPPGLAWNQLPIVEQYPMDQVARIPTMEDVYLPVDDQIEEQMEYLWSQELGDAIDKFLDL